MRISTVGAIDSSSLDEFLRVTFPSEFPNGTDTIVSGCATATLEKPCTVSNTIIEGAIQEDDGVRYMNHFHDPTVEWPDAGLRVLVGGQLLPGVASGEDAIRWQQETSTSQFASWRVARDEYKDALLSEWERSRVAGLTTIVGLLGSLMHIVEDQAAPAHTRNDPHPLNDGFHVWADKKEGSDLIKAIAATHPHADPGLLQTPSASGYAPVPIANLIDTTAADRAWTGCGTDLGLAEYSHGRFLSDDRLFGAEPVFGAGGSYAEPSLGDMMLVDTPGPLPGLVRSYYQYRPELACDSPYSLAASTVWSDVVDTVTLGRPLEPPLDDSVFAGYGALLFPRAIGYSAALLDYFFRGRVAVSPVCCVAPGGSTCWNGEPGSSTAVRVKISNISAAGEETVSTEGANSEGTAWAVVESGATPGRFQVSAPLRYTRYPPKDLAGRRDIRSSAP